MRAAVLHECPGTLEIEEVIREFKPETEGRLIEWQIAELPPFVADPPMLKMVMVNLISNALKFTRPREQARIEIGLHWSRCRQFYNQLFAGLGWRGGCNL